MGARIRLQRGGHKGYAFYSIVIADSRSPRDGKFIEKIGTYNPNTDPATVDLKFERALHWVLVGAEPTDTVHSILSKEGVYLKKHLLGGVKKGAFGEAEADAKFNAWKENKLKSLDSAKLKKDEAKKAVAKTRLEAEQKINEAKAKVLAEKKAAEVAAEAAKEAEAAKAAAAASGKVENTAAAPVAEEAAVAEKPAKEAAPAEKPAEEPKAEPVKEAAPVEEAKTTEDTKNAE